MRSLLEWALQGSTSSCADLGSSLTPGDAAEDGGASDASAALIAANKESMLMLPTLFPHTSQMLSSRFVLQQPCSTRFACGSAVVDLCMHVVSD